MNRVVGPPLTAGEDTTGESSGEPVPTSQMAGDDLPVLSDDHLIWFFSWLFQCWLQCETIQQIYLQDSSRTPDISEWGS